MAELNEITVQPEDNVQITAPGLAPAYFEVHRNDNGRVHVRPVDDDTQEGVIYRGPSGLMVQGSNILYEIKFLSHVDYAVIAGYTNFLHYRTNQLGQRQADLAIAYDLPVMLEFMRVEGIPFTHDPLTIEDINYYAERSPKVLPLLIRYFGINEDDIGHDENMRPRIRDNNPDLINWKVFIDYWTKHEDTTENVGVLHELMFVKGLIPTNEYISSAISNGDVNVTSYFEIGRASCRERV